MGIVHCQCACKEALCLKVSPKDEEKEEKDDDRKRNKKEEEE